MKAWTDYPIIAFGDIANEIAPIREVQVISYDGNKYAIVLMEGKWNTIKSDYIYSKPRRFGEVPLFNMALFQKVKARVIIIATIDAMLLNKGCTQNDELVLVEKRKELQLEIEELEKQIYQDN